LHPLLFARTFYPSVLPALVTLIAMQELDTAAEAARRRLAEIPAADQILLRKVADASAAVDRIKARRAENQAARRELEKRVAVVDSRLARFDDHKAAVKTNQEFTALLHEIETAKAEKDALEEQILVLLEQDDEIGGEIGKAESALGGVREEAAAGRAELETERGALDKELARLAAERADHATTIDRPLLAKYDQLLKLRKNLAIVPLAGDGCSACHVRLRLSVAQHARRNAEIVVCDSCQRILYALPSAQAESAETPAQA
jgi:predicted  nucleic acid-binding Zn-ribbon protein